MNYLFEFQVPKPAKPGFTDKIPAQREAVQILIASGSLVSYALSMDRTRLWAVVEAASESAALDVISELPLTPYMKMQMHSLLFHNSLRYAPPAISLN